MFDVLERWHVFNPDNGSHPHVTIQPAVFQIRRGGGGEKPYKVSFMTRQIDGEFVMVWWEYWKYDPLEFLVDTLT